MRKRRLALVGAAGVLATGAIAVGLVSRPEVQFTDADLAKAQKVAEERQAKRAREQAEDRAYRQRLAKGIKGNPPGGPLVGTTPGEIIRDPESPVSTAVQFRVTNGWRVSGHRRFTAVYAGGPGVDTKDRSTGRFVIVRQNFVRVTQDVNVVDVSGAGLLTITHAPLGPGVRRSAQRSGEIEFTSKNGVEGTLHLTDDTVTLR